MLWLKLPQLILTSLTNCSTMLVRLTSNDLPTQSHHRLSAHEIVVDRLLAEVVRELVMISIFRTSRLRFSLLENIAHGTRHSPRHSRIRSGCRCVY